MEYSYPDNLKEKAKLFLWELKDVGVISVIGIIGAFAMSKTGSSALIVLTALYMFLTIKRDGVSVLNFITSAFAFLIYKQQTFEWQERT